MNSTLCTKYEYKNIYFKGSRLSSKPVRKKLIHAAQIKMMSVSMSAYHEKWPLSVYFIEHLDGGKIIGLIESPTTILHFKHRRHKKLCTLT